MTRTEVIAMAPPEAVSLFTRGNGTSGFYAGGHQRLGAALLEINFDDGRAPSRGEWLACKKADGSWFWYKNRESEAVLKLESIGWKWDEQAEEWKLEREVVTGEDATGRVFPIGEGVK